MRNCIFGAGVIGGFVAAQLAQRAPAGLTTPTIDEVYGLLRLRAENASAAR